MGRLILENATVCLYFEIQIIRLNWECNASSNSVVHQQSCASLLLP